MYLSKEGYIRHIIVIIIGGIIDISLESYLYQGG